MLAGSTLSFVSKALPFAGLTVVVEEHIALLAQAVVQQDGVEDVVQHAVCSDNVPNGVVRRKCGCTAFLAL